MRTKVDENSVATTPLIFEDGYFRAEFRAGDLGAGGPVIVGMRVVLVFKDDTEVSTKVAGRLRERQSR